MVDDPSGEVDTAWSRTVGELRLLEEDLEADGWEVAAIIAGHVAPEPPAAGDTDRFGLVYVIPGDDAETFNDTFRAGEFAEYEIFRQRLGQRLFLVTKLSDPHARTAILLAGNVDLTQSSALIETARDREVLYTHVQLLDGTVLGSFRHEDPSLFFEELAEGRS